MIKNIERIHPCKRDKILKALEYLEEVNKERKYIYKVVLFGSAVTENCSEDSDIDVCVYSNLDCTDKGYFNVLCEFVRILDNELDLVNYNQISNSLRAIIAQNGVAVYTFSSTLSADVK